MNWTRISIVVLGSGWFFLVSCAAGLFVGTRVVSQIDARDVSKGDTVHSNFSVVIPSKSIDQSFGVVKLQDLIRYEKALEGTDAGNSESYIMPNPGGYLGSDSSSFSYEVLENSANDQVIEVVETFHDGDNTIWSRYRATRSSVSPISSRMFYFGYMFTAFPYAVGFAMILYVVGRFLGNTNQKSSRENVDV